MPTRREHLNAVAAGSYIYAIGGRNGPSTAANERYDPANNVWASRAPMPTARSAIVLGVVAGFIYAAGGEVPMLFAVNEVYDIAGNTWGTSTSMAVPRHGVAAVSLAGAILAPGGGTVQGLQPTTYVDRFVPDAPSGVMEGGVVPIALAVLQGNLPNPFASSPVIRFSLGISAPVRLTILDTQGRRVRELLTAALAPARIQCAGTGATSRVASNLPASTSSRSIRPPVSPGGSSFASTDRESGGS